jgi:hypothetical protein
VSTISKWLASAQAKEFIEFLTIQNRALALNCFLLGIRLDNANPSQLGCEFVDGPDLRCHRSALGRRWFGFEILLPFFAKEVVRYERTGGHGGGGLPNGLF